MSHQLAIEHDVIGVGFGPSNLALAIALDECAKRSRQKCTPLFVEKQPHFTWHGGMLLPGSDMQISFLKDLVSLRDPTSPFTFVNYLHKRGRLLDFINCRTFYPSRVEFNDYLQWVAGHFKSQAAYGETIVAVEPVTAGQTVTSLRVHSRSLAGGETVRLARNLVVAVGGRPFVPPVFAKAADDRRLLHSSRYLDLIERVVPRGRSARVAIVGGGQSATEVTVDLHGRCPEAQIHLIFRGHALKPSDSSPFVNEIFNPDYTDFVYAQPVERRDAIVRNFRNTNYAVVDADLLDQLYRLLYQQRVGREERIVLRPRSEITNVDAGPDGIEIGVVDKFRGENRRSTYDVVILATGYDRETAHRFLEPIRRYIRDAALDRNYRLVTNPAFRPQIHLQGYSESSHGLSDTLLSVIAVRAQEIAESLLSTISRRELIA
ncbi:lysine N(6)-hydroxylase/L-ornithine N(5)-oxygenase family protein [Bradyrhizobium daqingense]|uniref:L-ornithine N5-oxygenase n=1 Tax=Bradyrhizobium daqingense TaxID=993502 RepID=A0A562LTD5_9BRAD|nr:lysine N(6)-hydroxylase/L-ornithine N(5)-oxygenase family protein [Bradyrhizobium daqingense]TWI10879.1 L-ornithine N5-oxygenase [Bradyrhizobium daqingense]UFS85871.1 lysine N(6)-hydroxylase/L-ornithine N(5)-oxygenase family protein [Bradyrhizobium daqingense]